MALKPKTESDGEWIIVGSSGMLGKALTECLPDRKTIGVSRSEPGEKGLDAADRRAVERFLNSRKTAVVIHAAALADVDGCEKDPLGAYRSNALTAQVLAQACSERRIPLIYVSTDYVFGGKKTDAYVETDPVGPVNVYGLTKLAGEWFIGRSTSPWAIVRTSWLFGAGSPANFVNAIAKKLKTEKEVAVLDDQRNCPTYTKDLCRALEAIAAQLIDAKQNGDPYGEIFHVCNASPTTRFEMAVRMKEILASSCRVSRTTQIPDRKAIRPTFSAMDTSKYQKTFGTTLRTWTDSLEDYLRSQ